MLVIFLSLAVADALTEAICFEAVGGRREDEVVAKLGRLADVIIVPRPNVESAVGHTLTLNAALFETGRPVLVVPPKGAREIGKR